MYDPGGVFVENWELPLVVERPLIELTLPAGLRTLADPMSLSLPVDGWVIVECTERTDPDVVDGARELFEFVAEKPTSLSAPEGWEWIWARLKSEWGPNDTTLPLGVLGNVELTEFCTPTAGSMNTGWCGST